MLDAADHKIGPQINVPGMTCNQFRNAWIAPLLCAVCNLLVARAT